MIRVQQQDWRWGQCVHVIWRQGSSTSLSYLVCTYTCIYVPGMYIHVPCMYIHVYLCTLYVHTCTLYVHTRVSIYLVCTYTCIYVPCMYIHMYLSTLYVHTRVSMYLVCTYMCIYVPCMYIHVYLCTYMHVYVCMKVWVHKCTYVCVCVLRPYLKCVVTMIRACTQLMHVCVMQVQQHVCIYALLSCDLSLRTTGSCEVRSRAIPAANVSSEPSRGSSALPVPSRFHFSHTFRERWRLMRTSPYRYLPRLCLTLSSPSAMTAASRALAEHDTSTFLEVGRGWEWGGGVEGGR